ncbi:phenylacetic acid degradation protein [alpha proteobacterium AAP81b]|nr:phenylacetic acid degradation protein [alpha proteobacterium AAP81b]
MVPFAGHLGFEVIRCDRDACIVEVTLRPEHCTAGGTAHGGFLMTLADFAGAAGAWMVLPEGAKGTTTSDSKTNMIGAAAAGSRLVATATPVHIGRRTSVWQTRVTVGDKLISLTMQTQMVL